eukprot:4958188-Prymnesium_polylepis.1
MGPRSSRRCFPSGSWITLRLSSTWKQPCRISGAPQFIPCVRLNTIISKVGLESLAGGLKSGAAHNREKGGHVPVVIHFRAFIGRQAQGDGAVRQERQRVTVDRVMDELCARVRLNSQG